MAKSKLLTAAVMCSAFVLVACGGNTDTSDQGSTTTTETTPAVEDTLTLEPDTEINLDPVDQEPEVIIDDTVMSVEDNMANELLEMTLVYFDFDKSDIRPEFRDMLDAHATYLIANPYQMVVLEGHADERGTREYNLALGERRAKQVAAYLQVKGVSAAQIDTVSYGEEKPLAIGKTEAEYSQNRRVEIVYK
jgi:peptidoglycan-associated lipoprotein